MMRLIQFLLMVATTGGFAFAQSESQPEPLPIDPLWQSESFRKVLTGSYGIDSRIEPRISVDEEDYLRNMAEAMAAGDRKRAISILVGSELLDRSPALCFQLGCLSFEEGDLEEAVTHLESAIEQFPNFRDAHRNLAVALVQKGDLENAFPHLVRSVALGANDALTMGLLGYCHAHNDNHQAALDSYRIASVTQPEERQWRIGEAQALQNLGESEMAAKIYGSLLDEVPTDTALWLTEADAFLSLGKTIPALSNLEFVHRMEGLSPSATLSLGHLYLQAELPGFALERYQAALSQEPPVGLSEILDTVELFLSKQDFERAGTLLDSISASAHAEAVTSEALATDLAGKWERAHALVAIETGDAASGAERLTSWLERDPTDGLALLLLARFEESEGNREEAEMLLEQAAALPEHAAEALKAHGKLLVAQREYERALGYLRKSQELEPTESLGTYIEAVAELAD